MKVLVTCNCYRRLALTKLCLPIAIEHAGMDAQWLLVDDGSRDGTSGFLLSLTKDGKMEFSGFAENKGHYVRRNQGFECGLERGADVVVNIDNDILLPVNWLRDFIRAFQRLEFGVGSAWIVNDKTLTGMVKKGLHRPLAETSLDCWVETGGCGGACIAHDRAVLEAGCRYDEKRPLFCYGDANFNGQALRKGFKIGVYLGVQCWHLDWIMQPDPEYQEWKLRLRHQERHGSLGGFDESLKRHRAMGIMDRRQND